AAPQHPRRAVCPAGHRAPEAARTAPGARPVAGDRAARRALRRADRRRLGRQPGEPGAGAVTAAVHVALAVAFTAVLYAACTWLRGRLRLRLAHPVLLSVVLGCTIFSLLPPAWLDAYLQGSAPLRWRLGPAAAGPAPPFF